ncbi:hypothetical protein QUA54_06600 [Microcoleus sp. MOSTC5]|uniref:hypothetical protein n=1 Tax=Microcoleus sp. MOSTC5 TaxID=3055378 RepID=UPI002FD52589
MSKWRSVFGTSRLTIDSIESSIDRAALPACQTSGIEVKTITGDGIAKARAIGLPGNTDPESASDFPARRARLGLWTSVPWLFQGTSYLWFISKGAIA